MQKFLRISPLVFLFGLFFLFVSCGDDDGDNPITPNDKDAADDIVVEANDAFETIMLNLINSIANDGVQEPNDIDMTYPYNLYLDALDKDVDHPTANFGAGILGIAMLTQNEEIQTMFDRFAAMEDFIPFEIIIEDSPTSLPGTTPVPGKNWAEIPALSPKLTGNPLVIFSEDIVTIGEMQSLVRDTFLPALNTAIDRLELTLQDADFAFTVTPRMQGDANEDAIEIDNTDVHALMAGLYSMRAIGYQSIAYDFDLGDYSVEELMAALEQQSDFAALAPGGAEYMYSAGNSWQSALTHLETAIHLLEGETDPQSNDLIRIDPYDGMAQADLDSLLNYIPKVRQTLTSQSDWVINPDTGEELTISLNAFFYTPIDNFKALLPSYTVTYDSTFLEGDSEYLYNSYYVYDIPDSVTGYYQREMEWHYGTVVVSDEYGYGNVLDYFNTYWDGLVEDYVDPTLSYVYMSVCLEAESYWDWPYLNFYIEWREAGNLVAEPVLIWQADTVDDWILPDPTLNGALPGMTDSRIKEMMQIDESSWSKRFTLEY